MNIIHEGRSLDAFWDELFYLNARLQSNPKTVGLAMPVEGQLATFDDLSREERSTRGVMLMSQAKAQAAEDKIKDDILDLYMLVFVEVKKNRKDERYTKLIKVNESGFARYNFNAKKAEVMRMKSVLKQTIYEDAFRDKANEILDRVMLEIEGALAAELEAEEKRAQHRIDVKVWKDETNNVRLDVYAELIKLGESDGKTWARGFFPKKAAVKKLSAEELANQEEARAKKRTEKAAAVLEREKVRLANAAKKAAAEKAKADLDANLKTGGVPEPPVPEPPVSDLPVDPPVLVLHEEPAQA